MLRMRFPESPRSTEGFDLIRVKPLAAGIGFEGQYPAHAPVVDGFGRDLEHPGYVLAGEKRCHGLSPRLGLAAILPDELFKSIERLIVRFCFSPKKIPDREWSSVYHFGNVLDCQIMFAHILDKPFFDFIHYVLTSILISQAIWLVKYYFIVFYKIY